MAKSVLGKLEMVSPTTHDGDSKPSVSTIIETFPSGEKRDFFVEKNGVRYAGTHLLLEMWGGRGLDDVPMIEKTLCDATRAAGATILHVHTHRFSSFGGVSGVVVLAESHISIHTWPEREYIAIDIFMCGDCDPYDAVPVLRRAFKPSNIQLSEHKRGLIP